MGENWGLIDKWIFPTQTHTHTHTPETLMHTCLFNELGRNIFFYFKYVFKDFDFDFFYQKINKNKYKILIIITYFENLKINII